MGHEDVGVRIIEPQPSVILCFDLIFCEALLVQTKEKKMERKRREKKKGGRLCEMGHASVSGLFSVYGSSF
jgi:hypothetical protein